MLVSCESAQDTIGLVFAIARICDGKNTDQDAIRLRVARSIRDDGAIPDATGPGARTLIRCRWLVDLRAKLRRSHCTAGTLASRVP